jgi:hypothetical protein
MSTTEGQTTGIDVEVDAGALDWIDHLARCASPPISRDEVITELIEDAIARGWRPQPTP